MYTICLCRLCFTALSNQLVMPDLLSHCVWLWIICYDGWICLVTSCLDVCQSRLSVNRNVEKNERKCPQRPCSHTQIIIIRIPHELFVYLFRQLERQRAAGETATRVGRVGSPNYIFWKGKPREATEPTKKRYAKGCSRGGTWGPNEFRPVKSREGL